MTSSPAAWDTLRAHFADTGRTPADYDAVVTGDLGHFGHAVLEDLARRDGVTFPNVLTDCGMLLYDRAAQDVHAGASGCGCSAAVLCTWLLDGMRTGRWKKLLFCGTGALMSPTSSGQGESIPGICHAVAISATR